MYFDLFSPSLFLIKRKVKHQRSDFKKKFFLINDFSFRVYEPSFIYFLFIITNCFQCFRRHFSSAGGNLYKEIFTRCRVHISEAWRSKTELIHKTFWKARFLAQARAALSFIYYAFRLVLLYVEIDQKFRLNNWRSHEWQSEVDGCRRS